MKKPSTKLNIEDFKPTILTLIVIIAAFDYAVINLIKQIFQKLSLSLPEIFLSLLSYLILFYAFIKLNSISELVQKLKFEFCLRVNRTRYGNILIKFSPLVVLVAVYLLVTFFGKTRVLSLVSDSNQTGDGVHIESISPAEGIQGTIITITGSGFGDEIDPNLKGKQVMFMGRKFPVREWKNEYIKAEVPLDAPIGKDNIFIVKKYKLYQQLVVTTSNSISFNRLDPARTNLLQWLRTIKHKIIKK